MARKKNVTTNEFNQVIEGTSLTKEAWKRLKKNKMAVFGMVVVIIYALVAAFANLLPLYPYDEIVTDHQHLKPSLTKTSGELLLEKKYKDVFTSAWKGGRLVLSDEENEKVTDWVMNDNTNKAWNLLYERGMEALENGTLTLSASEQKQIDKTKDKIESDIMVTIKKLYGNINGEKVNLSKATTDQLYHVYANISGADIQKLQETVDKELLASIKNSIKSSDSDGALSQEDIDSAALAQFENYSNKEYDSLVKANLYGKISAQANKTALKQIKADIKAGKEMQFPIDSELELGNGISADLEVSKTNERRYIFGTDYLGRDLLSRIIYGGRVSIAIGLIGTITSILIGICVGSIAGYVGGKVDYYLMRFVDVMYGLPYMLLVIIFMAIWGRKISNLFLALSLISWLTIARMVRGQIMSLKNQEYVEAARSMGASTFRIIAKHMIPNSLSIIIVYSTIRIPNFIMQESFLSFLGLGVQAPYASWGSLIGDAVNSMTLYPWKLIFPSITMVLFLFSMNFFGDGLRDAFDPQSKNQL